MPSHRQRSGAQTRKMAKERARERASVGQLELKLHWTSATTRSFIRVEEFEPLVATGDLSDDDLLMPARLSAALVELLPGVI